MTIFLDFETYSDVDLKKSGIYRYAESDCFEILLFSYSLDGGEVQTIDLACGQKIPDELLENLVDENVTKWAYNASFERICLSSFLHKHYPELIKEKYLSPDSWRCSLVLSAYNGLPLSLDNVGKILKLETQKMSEGTRLIKYFCCPTSDGDRNYPYCDPAKWRVFKEYNKRDVETELAINKRLEKYPVPEFLWDEYHMDQRINDRGIMVDMDLVNAAIDMNTRSHNDLILALQQITNIDNPNSTVQLKTWLSENGLDTETLGKKTVQKMMKTAPEHIKEVLSLRLQVSKSSVKKYEAIRNSVCKDNRVHGMFMFYGANRTGRWSGRCVQLHNLVRNTLEPLEEARNLVKTGDYDAVKEMYPDVPDLLSQLIRTAFIAKPGYKFLVADYAQIEARVLSFLAGEEWRLKVFAENGDIYSATASNMFHVPVVKNGENAELRQRGKQSELSCGYGGGKGSLIAMGALDLGMKEEELQPLVDSWREANSNIVKFWWDVDKVAKEAVLYYQERGWKP